MHTHTHTHTACRSARTYRIEQVKIVKYLGVILDSHLSWNDHVRQLRNKNNKTVRMLKKLSHSVSSDIVKKLYCGVVLPALDYCIVVWIVAVQRLPQMRAPSRTSATLLRDRLGWSTLMQRMICHAALWTYTSQEICPSLSWGPICSYFKDTPKVH